MENRECNKILYIGKSGEIITIPKKKYENEKDAIRAACIMNIQNNVIHKCVAYKCPICHSWHVGRNKTILTNKDKEHYKSLLKTYYKIYK